MPGLTVEVRLTSSDARALAVVKKMSQAIMVPFIDDLSIALIFSCVVAFEMLKIRGLQLSEELVAVAWADWVARVIRELSKRFNHRTGASHVELTACFDARERSPERCKFVQH